MSHCQQKNGKYEMCLTVFYSHAGTWSWSDIFEQTWIRFYIEDVIIDVWNLENI